MESKSRRRGAVKRFDDKKTRKSRRKNSGLSLPEGYKRIRGYLVNCFADGKEYHDWNKHAFHRRTQWVRDPDTGKRIEHRRPLSVRTIEALVTGYKDVCTEFVWVRVRLGRSTILRVIRADPEGQMLPVPEIRRRLVGYIGRAVAINGTAHVDQEFLRHFWRKTGLPRELIHLVWSKTRKMAGYRVRWRGVNAGLKMVITRDPSLTQFRPGPISTYCVSEEIKPKTTGLSPRSTGGSSAPLRDARTEWTPAGGDPTSEHHASRAPPSQGADDRNEPARQRPTHGPPADWAAPPATEKPAVKWPVLIACGRPVDGRKLARLATLLAVTSMRAPHDEFFRVKWIFVYPRNFAYRALREGHSVEEILAAWRSGVCRSHEDSLDADKPVMQHGEWRQEPSRVPSAAVSYAHAELRKDPRTREERWAEIFARGPRASPPVAKSEVAKFSARARVPKPARADPEPESPAERAQRPPMSDPTVPDLAAKASPATPRPRASVADLRALLERELATLRGKTVEKQPEEKGEEFTAGELIAWLRDKKQMSAGRFAVQPLRVRQALIAEARAWKEKGSSQM